MNKKRSNRKGAKDPFALPVELKEERFPLRIDLKNQETYSAEQCPNLQGLEYVGSRVVETTYDYFLDPEGKSWYQSQGKERGWQEGMQ